MGAGSRTSNLETTAKGQTRPHYCIDGHHCSGRATHRKSAQTQRRIRWRVGMYCCSSRTGSVGTISDHVSSLGLFACARFQTL